jgi:Citrate synthase, C-terminal domain
VYNWILSINYLLIVSLIFLYIFIRAMGFPTEFFPVLFAVPRMAGYLGHWRESLDDPDTKIMRPQQVFSFVSFFFLSFRILQSGPYINLFLMDLSSPVEPQLTQFSIVAHCTLINCPLSFMKIRVKPESGKKCMPH